MFDDGLFDHGSHFKQGAMARLQKLSKALAQSPDPLEIQVIGYADDDRAFGTWTAQWESSLALDRASAVVDKLIRLGSLPSGRLSATIGDRRPFVSDTEHNRARNRTVVMRVSLAR